MGPVVRRAGARRARRLLLLTACVTVGVLGLGTVEANAATPSSLLGEGFASASGSASGSCSGLSGNGSFDFSTSGTATGPYPGTFTESGSFTITNGLLRGLSARFTINSPAGTVTGTKSLAFTTALQLPCNPTSFVVPNYPTAYTATINGDYRDTGMVSFTIFGSTSSGVSIFSEGFYFSNGVVQILPTSKDQCKDGGWQNFGTQFKNQGDCVSFVATGGQNPPSG